MVMLSPVEPDLLATCFDYFNALRCDWSDVVHPEFDWSAKGFEEAFSDHGVFWLVVIDQRIVGWVTELHRVGYCEVGFWVDGSLHPWALYKGAQAYLKDAQKRHGCVVSVFITEQVQRLAKALQPTTITDRGATWAAADQNQNLQHQHRSQALSSRTRTKT